jgi:hypothetical protein
MQPKRTNLREKLSACSKANYDIQRAVVDAELERDELIAALRGMVANLGNLPLGVRVENINAAQHLLAKIGK